MDEVQIRWMSETGDGTRDDTPARQSRAQQAAERAAARKLRREALELKAAQIKKKLERVKARERDDERAALVHRKIVIGGALLADIEIHPSSLDWVRDVLNRAVLREVDRAAIADLLPTARQPEDEGAREL